jgi:hypothetical protein
MPDKGETSTSDLGDALAGAVRALDGVRRAARRRAADLARDGIRTAGKVVDAIGGL